jgi:hypothetical protein
MRRKVQGQDKISRGILGRVNNNNKEKRILQRRSQISSTESRKDQEKKLRVMRAKVTRKSSATIVETQTTTVRVVQNPECVLSARRKTT